MLNLPILENAKAKRWCHNNFGSQDDDEEPRWQHIPSGAFHDGTQVVLMGWYCFAKNEDATLFGLTWA